MLHLKWFKKSYRRWIKSWDLLFLVPQVFCRETNIGSGGEKKIQDSRTCLPQKKPRERAGKNTQRSYCCTGISDWEGQDLRKTGSFWTPAGLEVEKTLVVQKDASSWWHTQGEAECMLAKWTQTKHCGWGGSIKHDLGGWSDAPSVSSDKSLDFCQLCLTAALCSRGSAIVAAHRTKTFNISRWQQTKNHILFFLAQLLKFSSVL